MRAGKAAATLAACALLLTCAAPALAAELSISTATERSEKFAKRTCAHDKHCVGHGVLNCNRHSSRVVLCRIYDDRRTKVQGRYRCNRLIRVSLRPGRGIPVTGLGLWHC